jgi:hypothetical protein
MTTKSARRAHSARIGRLTTVTGARTEVTDFLLHSSRLPTFSKTPETGLFWIRFLNTSRRLFHSERFSSRATACSVPHQDLGRDHPRSPMGHSRRPLAESGRDQALQRKIDELTGVAELTKTAWKGSESLWHRALRARQRRGVCVGSRGQRSQKARGTLHTAYFRLDMPCIINEETPEPYAPPPLKRTGLNKLDDCGSKNLWRGPASPAV